MMVGDVRVGVVAPIVDVEPIPDHLSLGRNFEKELHQTALHIIICDKVSGDLAASINRRIR
jgi:hypothetical protein